MAVRGLWRKPQIDESSGRFRRNQPLDVSAVTYTVAFNRHPVDRALDALLRPGFFDQNSSIVEIEGKSRNRRFVSYSDTEVSDDPLRCLSALEYRRHDEI